MQRQNDLKVLFLLDDRRIVGDMHLTRLCHGPLSCDRKNYDPSDYSGLISIWHVPEDAEACKLCFGKGPKGERLYARDIKREVAAGTFKQRFTSEALGLA